jgi:hypothetical protein
MIEPIYQLPQTAGSYVREADGSLTLIKPKADLAELVAAKNAAKPKQDEKPE